MYILITPVKDEEKHLPKVAESVIGQTVPPTIWVIVDDGSTDSTSEVIKNLKLRFNWIKSIELPKHPRDITFHYSYVCKNGFNHAIQLCKTDAIQYDFIGLLDADTVIEAMYFEKLTAEFNRNFRLGIASGYIIDVLDDEFRWEDIKNDKLDHPLPRGSGRFWRRECFLETGGYIIEPSPDSISNVKAKLKGWEIKQFGHIRAIQLRKTSGAQGLWKGYMINGSIAYYLNKHPILVLLNFIHHTFSKSFYLGIPYFFGYIIAVVKNEEKISDIEINNYYWNVRLREVIIKVFLKWKFAENKK